MRKNKKVKISTKLTSQICCRQRKKFMTLWMKPWVPTQSVGMVPSWLLQTCLFRRLTCNNVGNKTVYYKDTVECQHLQLWPEGRHGHAAELEPHQSF